MTVDDLRTRAKRWTAPVSPDSPTGSDARYDPRYEMVLAEVAKLDSPSGGNVNWTLVVDKTDELLRTTTKDLTLGTHLAVAMCTLHGLDDLVTGIALLTALVEEFWTDVWPERKRLRARVNAVGWFVERVSSLLARTHVSAAEGELVASLDVALGRFVDVVRDQFGAEAPALGPLREAVERLKLSVPPSVGPEAISAVPDPTPTTEPARAAEPSPEPPRTAATDPAQPIPTIAAESKPAPPPPSPAAPTTPSRPAPSTASASSNTMPPSFDAAESGAVDAATYLRQVGAALISSANAIRRGNTAEPSSYRVLRAGLWLHLEDAPSASKGRTAVLPPPETLRQSLARLAANGKWALLVDESESCLERQRLWLDPHRISAEALAALGPAYGAARQSLVGELGAFLRRVPALVELAFADGSPLADRETRAWLEADVLPRPTPIVSALPADAAEDIEPAARLAIEGKFTDAIALLQGRVASAPTAARAFRARLAMAQLLHDHQQPQVARALYSALDEEARARGLDAWDPTLAAACLEGYVRCVRILCKAGVKISEDVPALYGRLGRLSPLIALALGDG